MKIFDCVTFFEENRLMNLRFNILNKFVDKFIVCEGQYDHRGNPKKINFDKKNFPGFENKINHIICEKFPDALDPWKRQAFQRDFILENLDECSDNDLIMFSDPDEIPNPLMLKNLDLKKKYGIFLQKLFYYKINMQDLELGCNWEGTRICRKKNLKSIDYMRQKVVKKNIKYGLWRIDKEKNFEIISNGGWHFSYLLTAQEIQRKINTFAHTEFDLEKFTNMENINNSIKNGTDIFHRKAKYQIVTIDKSYPDFIRQNKRLLIDWIC